MFKLSMKAEYALRAVLHLALHDTVCTIEEIAKTQKIPRAFLKKIIQSLSVSGLITSVKGKKGGVILRVRPKELTFLEVLKKVEGTVVLNKCMLHEGACERDKICPLHEVWSDCQESIVKILDSYNFEDLAKREKQLIKSKKTGESKTEILPMAPKGLLPGTV